jgi:ribosome-associated translation inhibitor RaiA
MTARVEVIGLAPARAARLRADVRVAAALAALPPRVTSARVTFTDVNAAKGGPDLRCAISVNLRGRRRLHVSDVATTPRQALDGAVARLERRLARTEKTERDLRRRPKKYYAAARGAGRGV